MMVGPGASVGSLPVGGELERVSAGESQAPDPAWIASIANALFSGLPGESVTGPGASPPSCRVRRGCVVGAGSRRPECRTSGPFCHADAGGKRRAGAWRRRAVGAVTRV